uniref:Uncharacterized protein n=1 Tax=Odontella aurita TaxID=265563 RepID=A0A7S4M6F5_9STRA|mmetsp:Transcript_12091/g.35297  ORF Transcript_12091/g.35297 Transcript_12091/m.35297 type:complete len:119 (+) Transcript_12091:158-514(+)
MSVAARNFPPPALAPKLKGSKYGREDKLNLNCEDVLICTNNIMFDSRVVRGNTYASPVITEDQRRNREAYERKQRAQLAKKQESRTKQYTARPGTPPPVSGRVHIDVQTDPFLERFEA